MFVFPSLKILALTALIPLILGFIWYNPRVFGKPWMRASGITEESMKGANMILIFALTYVFGFFLSIALFFAVVHQSHVYSMVAFLPDTTLNDPTTQVNHDVTYWMAQYGHHYRTFKHGAFHGTLFGFLAVLPIVAVNAMFERKSFVYIAINAGFWIVNCIIMGAILCHFS